MPSAPDGLLRACEAAHREGKDFPSVWNAILKPHPLVLGLPAHRISDGEAQIVVRLLTGQRLICGASGYLLE